MPSPSWRIMILEGGARLDSGLTTVFYMGITVGGCSWARRSPACAQLHYRRAHRLRCGGLHGQARRAQFVSDTMPALGNQPAPLRDPIRHASCNGAPNNGADLWAAVGRGGRVLSRGIRRLIPVERRFVWRKSGLRDRRHRAGASYFLYYFIAADLTSVVAQTRCRAGGAVHRQCIVLFGATNRYRLDRQLFAERYDELGGRMAALRDTHGLVSVAGFCCHLHLRAVSGLGFG